MLHNDAELPSATTISRDIKAHKKATDKNVREFLEVHTVYNQLCIRGMC